MISKKRSSERSRRKKLQKRPKLNRQFLRPMQSRNWASVIDLTSNLTTWSLPTKSVTQRGKLSSSKSKSQSKSRRLRRPKMSLKIQSLLKKLKHKMRRKSSRPGKWQL